MLVITPDAFHSSAPMVGACGIVSAGAPAQTAIAWILPDGPGIGTPSMYMTRSSGRVMHLSWVTKDEAPSAITAGSRRAAAPLRPMLEFLATFGGDIAQTPDFSVHIKRGLPRTAAEVTSDIVNRNEGYLYYLVSTAIPVVLDYDSSFGAAKDALREALRRRPELGIDDERVRNATTALMKSMQ